MNEEPRIPASGYRSRHGDRWPAHVAKRRQKKANRRRAMAALNRGSIDGVCHCQ